MLQVSRDKDLGIRGAPWARRFEPWVGREGRFKKFLETAMHSPYVTRFIRRCSVTAGSGDVYRRRMRKLISTYSGIRVLVPWPGGYRYVVGPDKYFGVRLEQSDVYDFSRLKRYRWLLFGGLLCPGHRFPYVDVDVWIILTCSGEVFGYGPRSRLLYRLCNDMKEFVARGGVYVTELYDLPHVSMRNELDVYGLRICGEGLVWLLSGMTDPYLLLEMVNANCGSGFYGVDEDYVFTFGTRSYFELDLRYPACVLTCLENAGYYVIGLCSMLYRVVLLGVNDCAIFVLHGWTVVKAADDIRHFMRLRLRGFMLGCDFCFTVNDVGYDYVPVGSRIDFGCRAIYDVSEDYEIERKWFLRRPVYYSGEA